MRMLGLILIALGVIALAYQGISYTHKEKVVDVGPLHVSASKKETIPLPPILGALALVAGVVLLIAGGRRGSASGS